MRDVFRATDSPTTPELARAQESPEAPRAPRKPHIFIPNGEFQKYLDFIWPNFSFDHVIDLRNQLNKEQYLKPDIQNPVLILKTESWCTLKQSGEIAKYINDLKKEGRNITVLAISLLPYKGNGRIFNIEWNQDLQHFTTRGNYHISKAHVPFMINSPTPGGDSTNILVVYEKRDEVLQKMQELGVSDQFTIGTETMNVGGILYVHLIPVDPILQHDLKSPDDFLMLLLSTDFKRRIRISTDDANLRKQNPFSDFAKYVLETLLDSSARLFEFKIDGSFNGVFPEPEKVIDLFDRRPTETNLVERLQTLNVDGG